MIQEEKTLEVLKNLSRRDAIKTLGAISATPYLLNMEAKASIKSNAKIVIVGGGAAGITIAARLDRAMDNPDVTIIEPSPKHVYQAGHTLVGGGIVKASKLVADTKEYIPDSAKWEQTKATNIDPESQKVALENGKVLSYDYLIVVPGLQYDWNKIEGLDPKEIGNNGLNTIYTLKGAEKTWNDLQRVAKTGGQALFSHPNTPIKCGGAPKKIMFLMDDYLRKQNTRDKAELTYFASGGKMFPIPIFEKAIINQYNSRDMKYVLNHNLVKIDTTKKLATFATKVKTKGAWDEDLEEYTEIVETKLITREYDFIHVPPPMSAPDVVKNSPLPWQKGDAGELGLVEVDKFTLQHKRYKNIFSLGDVIGTPYGRTGGTVRKQAPVVVQNLIDVMEGREPSAKFGGYTVCPIITRYGKVLLAEFDYTGNPAPTIPGLAVDEERWMWWIMKVYILEPMYFYGMLRGLA